MDHSLPGSSVHEILQQEYWSGLPCPPPGDLPNLGIEPMPLTSPALAGRFFTISTAWEALKLKVLFSLIILFACLCPKYMKEIEK